LERELSNRKRERILDPQKMRKRGQTRERKKWGKKFFPTEVQKSEGADAAGWEN